MLEIYFIRHAECEMNLLVHLIGGRSNDSPLSSLGACQAHLLGSRFKHEGLKFDYVYCSPAIRTVSTASIVWFSVLRSSPIASITL